MTDRERMREMTVEIDLLRSELDRCECRGRRWWAQNAAADDAIRGLVAYLTEEGRRVRRCNVKAIRAKVARLLEALS